MTVFWEHGYEATSTEHLIRAMGIGRQSMYDSFGDKHRLYLEAFRLYGTEAEAEFSELVAAAATPFEAIRDHILAIAEGTTEDRSRGCLLVNSTTELAPSDPEIGEMVRSMNSRCLAAFEAVLQEAKHRGEVDPSVDERVAANFLLNTMRGLQVGAKAGVPPEDLREIALWALATLKPLGAV